MTSSKEPIIQ